MEFSIYYKKLFTNPDNFPFDFLKKSQNNKNDRLFSILY